MVYLLSRPVLLINHENLFTLSLTWFIKSFHRLQMSNVNQSVKMTIFLMICLMLCLLNNQHRKGNTRIEGFQNGGKSESNKFTSGEQLEDYQNNLVGVKKIKLTRFNHGKMKWVPRDCLYR